MLAKAIHQGWPVPDRLRARVIQELEDVFDDYEAGPREKIAAARAVMAADALNIEREKMSQADEHHGDELDQQRLNRLAAVASKLGLREIARIASEGGSGDLPAVDDATIEATKPQRTGTRSGRKKKAGKAKRSRKN